MDLTSIGHPRYIFIQFKKKIKPHLISLMEKHHMINTWQSRNSMFIAGTQKVDLFSLFPK